MLPTPGEKELEQFFAREALHLRGYLASLVGDADAGDLVQETFVRAQRARETCDGRALGPWIRRIARNIAIDHLRHSGRAVIPGSGDVAATAGAGCTATNADPERSAIRDEMNDCIGEFVRRLPERDAEIILLSEMRGLPDQEIAKTLGITLGAAKIRIHRARARLRGAMESGCDLYRDEDGLACDRKA